MASAQVLSNSSASSRKDHLEAGKRRLEEFRKKKAAAKKAASTTQPRTVVSSSDDKQALENGQAPFGSSVGAAGGGKTDTVTESSSFLDLSSKSYDYSRDSGSESVPAENVNHQFLSSDPLQMEPKQEGNSYGFPGLKSHSGFIYSEQTDDRVKNVETGTGEGRYADGVSSARLNAPHDNSGYFGSVFGVEQSHSDKDVSISRRFPGTYSRISDISAEVYADRHASDLLNNESDSAKPAMEAFTSDLGRSQHGAVEVKNHEERKPSIAVDNLSRFYSQQASESLSVGFNSDISGSYNGPAISATAETYPKRSRPSFLDSLNIDRESMASSRPYSEKEKSTTSKFSSSDMVASFGTQDHSTSSAPLEPLPTPVPSNPSTDFFSNPFRGQKLFENSLETNLESNSHKQNEDFAALEQHIEDLTQEKFSLQRTLEASKTLAESLAAENSSLTESYNQQASIVNQLRAEMENLQSEIKARLVELESFKAEYMNAQLECNAADERAKLLASEVIGLEEKALRLRSNELKLQRELENSSAELASYKKKLSSLEKERRDLMQTIDALQEEKKLLQTKFRKASASGISMDINKGHEKKDVSTSTNDLGLDTTGADGDSFEQASSNVRGLDDTDNVLLLAQNRSAGSEDSALSIPPDQMQMIQNINSLISEIMAEKEELVQALMTEVSTSTKLKELNKELLQKLEIQTQRLELLTSQNMANENIPTKQPTVSHVVRETVAYADEGDEVVERVLGWIMKLFPGGPSRRRSSRF